MKLLIVILCFLTTQSVFSQSDSVLIKSEYLENELAIVSELSDIQFIRLTCSDTLMRGKHFLFEIDEFENGSIIKQDTSAFDCTALKFPMVVGTDTIIHEFKPCESKKFDEKDSVYKIIFAGRLQNDSFKLSTQYPRLKTTKKLKGKQNYSLRAIHCSQIDQIKVKLNEITPILAYTPPFDSGNGANDYCILGTEKIESWYKKFKVKHFYIIKLKIE